MDKICLVNKNCLPCQGDALPLDQTVIDQLIIKLNPNWQINKLGHLQKQYQFNNFMDPMNFANKVANVSEKEAHHPILTIAWGTCTIEIWTHKINGLTEADFILATKIDSIQ